MGIKELLGDTKPLVHVLVCFFGIASWIDINGLWVELPLLVTRLPEGWTLPSYITIISQVANVGPIIFAVLVYFLPKRKIEVPASAFIIGIGILTCLLLSLYWKDTTVVGGERHGTALLALNFLLATVDTTSSVAFLAFMASLKVQYMATFFVGEGLSGMIPGLVSLAQGAGSIVCVNGSHVNDTFENGTWYNETNYSVYPMFEEPRFSVQVFFLILFGMMCASLGSFLVLNFHPYCKKENVENQPKTFQEAHDGESAPQNNGEVKESEPLLASHTNTESKSSTIQLVPDMQESETTFFPVLKNLSMQKFWLLIGLTVLINFLLISFLSSTQSYSTLPYGLQTFHLVTTLTSIADPVACILSLFAPTASTAGIFSCTVSGSAIGVYLIVAAGMSPTPPLVGHPAGGAISLTSWVLITFLLTYSKVSIAGVLRKEGRTALIWFGAFTQIGAFIGAVLGYILVNVYKVFKAAPYC